MSGRAFWLRLGGTMALVAVPMAWLVVFLELPLPILFPAAAAIAVALLAVWDGARLLPRGLVFWAKPEPLRDPTSGLYNPEGFEELLSAEEDRCRRHDLSASVVVVRVKTTGGETPPEKDASEVGDRVKRLCRKHDVAGYLGDATFAVLAVASDNEGSSALVRRLQSELQGRDLKVRWAAMTRSGSRDLGSALRIARERVVSIESGSRLRSA